MDADFMLPLKLFGQLHLLPSASGISLAFFSMQSCTLLKYLSSFGSHGLLPCGKETATTNIVHRRSPLCPHCKAPYVQWPCQDMHHSVRMLSTGLRCATMMACQMTEMKDTSKDATTDTATIHQGKSMRL